MHGYHQVSPKDIFYFIEVSPVKRKPCGCRNTSSVGDGTRDSDVTRKRGRERRERRGRGGEEWYPSRTDEWMVWYDEGQTGDKKLWRWGWDVV